MKKMKNGEWLYAIESRIATPNVNQDEQGGISAVNEKPRTSIIWNRTHLKNKLNIYDDMSEYLETIEKFI